MGIGLNLARAAADSRDAGFGNIVPGVFTPVLVKHSTAFSLVDCISVGVDRMQRNFKPMRKQVEACSKVRSIELRRGKQR
jgi:hypothetical protein